MDVTLVMFKSDGARRDFALDKPRIIIGRKNTCDLRIPLTSVSRQHCELWIEGDNLHLRDLASSNGTYHNDNRVQEAVLAAGDNLVIGPVVFTIIIDGLPDTIDPVRTVLDDQETADTGQSPALPAQSPQPLEASGAKLPAQGEIEIEQHTPTVDLDDPIAALEALADAAAEDDDDLDEFDFLSDDK